MAIPLQSYSQLVQENWTPIGFLLAENIAVKVEIQDRVPQNTGRFSWIQLSEILLTVPRYNSNEVCQNVLVVPSLDDLAELCVLVIFVFVEEQALEMGFYPISVAWSKP